jgi:hypothetical protein
MFTIIRLEWSEMISKEDASTIYNILVKAAKETSVVRVTIELSGDSSNTIKVCWINQEQVQVVTFRKRSKEFENQLEIENVNQ